MRKLTAFTSVTALAFLSLAGEAVALNHGAVLNELGRPGNSEQATTDGRGVAPAVNNSPIVGPPVLNVQPPVGNNTTAGANPSDLAPGTTDDSILCELGVTSFPFCP